MQILTERATIWAPTPQAIGAGTATDNLIAVTYIYCSDDDVGQVRNLARTKR